MLYAWCEACAHAHADGAQTCACQCHRPAVAIAMGAAELGAPHVTQNRAGSVDPPSHTTGGKFAPGNRANPGGRPKRQADVEKELFEKYQGDMPKILDVQIAKAMGGNTKAATFVWDRIMGKPTQRHEVAGPGGRPLVPQDVSRMTTEEKRAYHAYLMAKARGENPTPPWEVPPPQQEPSPGADDGDDDPSE